MTEATVLLERRDEIALLTLSDEKRLNAMTEGMGQALTSRVSEIREDPDLRVVVLTGAGRAFSAGGDLDMIQAKGKAARANPGDQSRNVNRLFMRDFYAMFLSIRDIGCPIIAAINGPAIGAGFCVALACDIRIAAYDAKIGLNFVRLGMHPGMGATWTLPRIVGPAKAAELLFTGRILDGKEADNMGLVNRAVERDEVLVEAMRLAKEIASNSPPAVTGVREALAQTQSSSLAEQLDFEATQQARNYESQDLMEGLRAVREKRRPRFTGQ